MDNAKVLIKFEGDTKDFDSKAKKVNVSMGSVAKGVLAATGITKALSAAWNMVSNSMDGAISRIDTMNNFSTVMKNMGISAKDSQDVIESLSDELVGLPTTLNDAAASVQRLTSYNGNIKSSEKIFLAMNNAILAGTNNTQMQAAALEQLTQAYTKGKPEMQDWKTLLQAMPAQLKQVALAMGYSGTNELYENLQAGTVTMDDFMNTLVKLNDEGVAGFASLNDQARANTAGIATSVQNMKTAVTRGVANVIQSLDKGLKDAGMGGLSQVIANIGKTMENVLKQAAKGIQTIVPKIVSIFQWMKKHETLVKTLAAIIIGLVGAFKLLKIIASIGTIISGFMTTIAPLLAFFRFLIGVVQGLMLVLKALWVVMMSHPIFLIIAVIVALVAVFIYLWKHCEGFRNFFIGMWEGIKTAVNASVKFVVNLFTSIVDFFKSNWSSLLLLLVNPFAGAFKLLYDNCEGFRNFVNNFVSTIANFFINLKNKIVNAFNNVVNAIKQLPGKIRAIPGRIIGFFASLPSQMASVGLNIVKGIGNGITSGITWIKNKIRAFVGNVTSFIKKVFKIGSPSKLMENQVGQWIPKGIALGITTNTDSVNKAMSNMQKDISSTFGLSPQVANTTALNYNPNVVVNNQISMKQDPLGQMVSNIKTFSGGAKNDYNYGASY